MKVFLLIIFVGFSAAAVAAQTASNESWPPPFPGDRRRPDDDSRLVKNMLSKQQTAREKKEYAELVERGEAALKLSTQLEKSIALNERLTAAELGQLEEYEDLVSKIRDGLGGDDDDDADQADDGKGSPKDVRQGFITLKRSTEKLVSEIKKSTRYSVSIAAIESSNSLIRLARFLRLKN